MAEYLFVPIRNGRTLTDSQGKPRMYKSASVAVQILEIKKQEWDEIKVYVVDDVVSREDFEKKVRSNGKVY